MTRARKRSKKQNLAVGSLVLIGRPGISMPGDWWLAKVLWTDGTEILTEHQPPGGIPERYLQVLEIEYVRAVGTISELVAFKRRCAEAVKKKQARVRRCEDTLADARKAMWHELDKIAADVKVAPK